jgi:hypothetical protein
MDFKVLIPASELLRLAKVWDGKVERSPLIRKEREEWGTFLLEGCTPLGQGLCG